MLADPRADALGSRFAAQWLRLQDVDKVHPDPNFYPNYDDNLAADDAPRDRAVLQQPRARGSQPARSLSRRTTPSSTSGSRATTASRTCRAASSAASNIPDDTRRGLLGQGSVLVQTSLANRTSPVLRGKWVMEVLMGTPPPPPPPDIPTLEETADSEERQDADDARAHGDAPAPTRRATPATASWIRSAWRSTTSTSPRNGATRENGMPLDTKGDYYDGTPVTTPAELLRALTARPVPLVRTFTENLLAYALGRRTEDFDQPTIRAIAQSRGGERLPPVVVHPRRDQERRLSDASAEPVRDDDDAKGRVARSVRLAPDCARCTRLKAALRREHRRRHDVNFITGKQMPRRTFLRGVGATVALAVPGLDGARPAARAARQPRRAHAARLHRGGPRPGRLQQLGREQAPVRAGDDRAATSRWSPDNPLKALEGFRDYMTIVSNTDVRNAEAFALPRDRRRPLPLERACS